MKFVQGWINLYKPKNITSFKAIKKIKQKFDLDKIGHAGTLDPLAEGILPVALGKTTKLIPFINSNIKTYNFTVTWGSQTSTDDCEGKIIYESGLLPDLKEIGESLPKYIGKINQIPPKVSAVKIHGERAYKLARKQRDFSIKPKNVYVKNLKIIKHNTSTTSFKIECGKGFYIRSLARDLGNDLKTFGHISSLERTKVGKFDKETSILLDDLLKIVQRQSEINCIKPSISMLDDILAFEIVANKDLKNLQFGRSISIDEDILEKSKSTFADKKLIFLSHKGDVISIGKLVGNLFIPKKILI